ncbi:MAG: 3-deoxy-manno-octulosonate cytidylyltransferase [Flavobacteriales bacterium]|nr:3-deoxy-manno-octulosonate cytidylyltransferase [Flavobacteriales bacterium]
MKVLGIIPSRYASSRLPGKPLKLIGGKTMIRRVYEQAAQAKLDALCVATDDERILDHVISFNGKAIMTSESHLSGTDRCAEVVTKKQYEDFEIIINIQGDEPFIDPNQINLLIELMKTAHCEIGTLISKTKAIGDIVSENTAKVVTNKNNTALYFSRSAIPFQKKPSEAYLHIGMYGYKKEVLLSIAQLSPTDLEKTERLEQLRWLENGFKIQTKTSEHKNISVDTPEDLARAQKMV